MSPARDTPSKKNVAATVTTVPEDFELEHAPGSSGQATPSGSSLSALDKANLQADSSQERTARELEAAEQRRASSTKAAQWRRRLEAQIPKPVARSSSKIKIWIEGPNPPAKHRINPLFERWQTLPSRTLARLPKWLRIGIYGIACLLWAIIFGVILSEDSLPEDIGDFGAPVRLGCVTNLWSSPQACGTNGQNCLPFNNASFAFNCPANCLSAQVLNPRAIGPQNIVYRPLVVGGGPDPSLGDAPVYRGDSFICGAAIHAGVLRNGNGGCGVLSLRGSQDSFEGVNRNGISSVGFDSTFPMSFSFDASTDEKCEDPRWNLLTLTTIFTTLIGIFTSSSATFFAPIFTAMFFQVAMASDPPPYNTYAGLASTAIGRFVPAAFVMAFMYRFTVHKTLKNCKAPIEKTILWVGGAWVGALGNYTFDQIPIQRLTGHDIRQQPGAITALVIIVLILFALILYQCWCLRTEGRLPRFLALYATFGICLGLLAALPSMNVRIHHYIIALLLLPGTSMQTRASLLCQGLLVGLFINGIARWDFDPIVQTAAALRGDAQLGSGIPSILDPVINGSSITFAWSGLARGYEGLSVLVNDVERFRSGAAFDSPFDSANTTSSNEDGGGSFTWTRRAMDKPEYFRFGFVNYVPFGGVSYSDFTRAGTWDVNGTWSGIPKGRTGA